MNLCRIEPEKFWAELAGASDSPMAATKETFTYARLLDEVSTLAAALVELGIRKGDRVILHMAMVPQAIFAMLACARTGAVHSVVFGGFTPDELATRINDVKPRAILTACCGLELNRVIADKPLSIRPVDIAIHKLEAWVVPQRPQVAADLTPDRDRD